MLCRRLMRMRGRRARTSTRTHPVRSRPLTQLRRHGRVHLAFQHVPVGEWFVGDAGGGQRLPGDATSPDRAVSDAPFHLASQVRQLDSLPAATDAESLICCSLDTPNASSARAAWARTPHVADRLQPLDSSYSHPAARRTDRPQLPFVPRHHSGPGHGWPATWSALNGRPQVAQEPSYWLAVSCGASIPRHRSQVGHAQIVAADIGRERPESDGQARWAAGGRWNPRALERVDTQR